MGKFAISVAVVFVTALAVLVLSTSECRRELVTPDAEPIIPDVTTATSTVSQILDARTIIQLADSGSVESAPGGKYLLTLHGMEMSVDSEDGIYTMDLGFYMEYVFGNAGVAEGMLNYDGSRGPAMVTLSDPKVVLTDGGSTDMSYVMEVAGGGQVLARFKRVILRVNVP